MRNTMPPLLDPLVIHQPPFEVVHLQAIQPQEFRQALPTMGYWIFP